MIDCPPVGGQSQQLRKPLSNVGTILNPLEIGGQVVTLNPFG
jgi:hypothetical protein